MSMINANASEGLSSVTDDSVNFDKPLTVESLRSYLKDNVFSVTSGPEHIGVELEAFLLRSGKSADDGQDCEGGKLQGILAEDRSQTAGLLLDYAQQNNWDVLSEELPDGGYVITGFQLPGRGNVSFEPAKQVEYSCAPQRTIHDLVSDVRDVQELVKAEISREQSDLKMFSLGSYPLAVEGYSGSDITETLHVPKARYRALLTYMMSINSDWGERLMKHTCATQVCLDAGKSEEDVASRYATGYLLAPLSYGIFAHSPFVQGQLSKWINSRIKMVESFEASRMGLDTRLIKRMSSEDDVHQLSHYLNYYEELVMGSGIIPIPGAYSIENMPKCSFGEWFEKGIDGSYPKLADLVVQLSLVFPEVRVKKGFYELRSADAQAPTWQFVPLMYYLGLMLNEDIRKKVRSILLKDDMYYTYLWQQSRYGFVDKEFSKVAVTMMELAIEGLSQLPQLQRGLFSGSALENVEVKRLEVYAEHFTFSGRTPSDDLKDKVMSRGDGEFSEKVWHEVTADWQNLI